MRRLASALLVAFFVSGCSSRIAAESGEIPEQVQTTPSAASPLCGKRSAFVTQLKKRYAETPVSIGLASNGSMIEVFVSPSGSFSILVSRPEGISCMVTSGDNWQTLRAGKGI